MPLHRAPTQLVPHWKTGLYYDANEGRTLLAQSNAALSAAGRLIAAPLKVPYPVSIDRLGVRINTTGGGTSTVLRCAIYLEDPTTGLPGALFCDPLANLDAATANVDREHTVALILPAGTLWTAVVSDGNPTIIGYSGSTVDEDLGWSSLSTSTRNCGPYVAFALVGSGALPNPFGTPAGYEGRYHRIAVRKA